VSNFKQLGSAIIGKQ